MVIDNWAKSSETVKEEVAFITVKKAAKSDCTSQDEPSAVVASSPLYIFSKVRDINVEATLTRFLH